jgi:hypothetical protein
MLSNIPLAEMDWYRNTNTAADHVKAGVDFAKGLPIGGRRIVTFHLNSLVSEGEFLSRSAQRWREYFAMAIAPSLAKAARYAQQQEVELKVETVPVPEFGDIPIDRELMYLGTHARDLRNPFYLTRHWGFQELRHLGIGICLDVCHTRTIYRVAQQSASTGILFEEDKEVLAKESIINDVMGLLPSDLAHLNDGSGDFTKEGEVFKEGVALGQGDIAQLPKIIHHLNATGIPFVIEVDERGDFKGRPGTTESIEYLLKL